MNNKEKQKIVEALINAGKVIIPEYVEPRVRCQRARVPKKESRPS